MVSEWLSRRWMIGCSLDREDHVDSQRMKKSLKYKTVLKTFLPTLAKLTQGLNSKEK